MQRAVQPTVFGCFYSGCARFHEVLRVEVRACGVGRSGGVNDGQMALLPKRLEGRERRMESEESVEIKHRVAGNIDGWPHGVVCTLVVGHDDVEAVGCAALEDDDETLVLCADGLSGVRGPSQKCGNSGR